MARKLLIIFALIYSFQVDAQITRNDHYSAFGILSSYPTTPYGVSLYSIERQQKFGFYTELKINRLSFNSAYDFKGDALESDKLRNSWDMGKRNMVKMINIGTVYNPQQSGIMQWDFIDIDFCIGLGYIQDFVYQFYNDPNGYINDPELPGYDPDQPDLYLDPLGKYYVIDSNNHGFNLNIGTNLSIEKTRLLVHIGYDSKPKALAIGINWKVK